MKELEKLTERFNNIPTHTDQSLRPIESSVSKLTDQVQFLQNIVHNPVKIG